MYRRHSPHRSPLVFDEVSSPIHEVLHRVQRIVPFRLEFHFEFDLQMNTFKDDRITRSQGLPFS